MDFKPYGDWLAVRVPINAKQEYDADGRLVLDYGDMVPNVHVAQGRIADLGDYSVIDVGLGVGHEVLFFKMETQPVFVEEGDEIRLIQIGDVIAVNREPNKETS